MKPNFNRLPLNLYRERLSKRRNVGACVAAALCVVSAITGLFTAPSALAAGPIRPVYVEPVLPSKPFSKILFSQMLADGPDAGVLGITSLTMYNTDSTDSFINVYATQVVGPTCASMPIDAGSRYLFFFRVPSGSTFHATFPSPLVVEPIPGAVNGLTCIRFKGTTNTLSIMMVNGFVN